MSIQYLHIDYIPENGWVLSIMGRLSNSPNPHVGNAFASWSDTPLKELGLAITTRMIIQDRDIVLGAKQAQLQFLNPVLQNRMKDSKGPVTETAE